MAASRVPTMSATFERDLQEKTNEYDRRVLQRTIVYLPFAGGQSLWVQVRQLEAGEEGLDGRRRVAIGSSVAHRQLHPGESLLHGWASVPRGVIDQNR